MTQGIGGYGNVIKLGTAENGRVIYQINSPDGQSAGKLSVAQKDADTFEKSYKDIMEVAPSLQKYSEKMTPEKYERRKKTGKWTGIGVGAVLTAVPLFFAHKWTSKKWLQWLSAIGGAFVGLIAGVATTSKISNPPGAIKFSRAMQAISKIDAQPVE